MIGFRRLQGRRGWGRGLKDKGQKVGSRIGGWFNKNRWHINRRSFQCIVKVKKRRTHTRKTNDKGERRFRVGRIKDKRPKENLK